MKVFLAILVIIAAMAFSVWIGSTFHFSVFENLITGVLIGTGGGRLAAAILY